MRPTVGIALSDSAFKIGDTATITFTFSEVPTDFTVEDVTAPSGALSDFTVTGDTKVYTATFTPTADFTDATNIVTVGTVWTDPAGNAPIGSTDSANYTVDTHRPTVGIVVTDTALKAGETSLVTFTFNEAVTGFTNADLTAIEGGTLSPVSSADGGITWTATFTPTAGLEDTTNIITIDKTGVADLAGNAGSGTTNSNNYAIDTLLPTLTSVAIVSNNANSALAKSGDTVMLTFTASEPIAAPTVTIQGIVASSIINTVGNTWTASRAMTGTDTEGGVTFSIAFADTPAGNSGVTVTATTNASAVLYDRTAPSVNAGTDKEVNATSSQNATTSDDGSGLNTHQWAKQSGPGIVTFGSATAVDTTISTDTDGTYIIRLTVTDNAGNSYYDEITFIWDTTRPEPLTSAPSDGATGVSIADGTATVTFDEPVVLLDATRVLLVNDATGVSHKGAVVVSGTPTVLNIPYSGLEYGTKYRINVKPNAVSDVATNRLLSNFISYFTTVAASGDTTPPTISLTSETPSQTGAAIVFQSTETGTGWIRYGLGTDYGNVSETVTLVAATNKTVDLTGLTCNTLYHYSIYAKDAALNESHNLGDDTFTTSACSSAVIPTIALHTGDAAIVSAYSLTEANTRFASGLRFDVTNNTLVTSNGATIVPIAGVATVATNAEAKTLGAHTYNVVVTSSTGNTAEMTVAYQVNADSVVPVIPTIALDGVAIVSTYTATAADTRFTANLVFSVGDTSTATINGANAPITAGKISVAKASAITVGAHGYDVIVTSITGHTATLNVTYQVTADAVTPVIPTIALHTGDAAIVSAYSLTEANTRFASGLRFDVTNNTLVTSNGATIVPIAGVATVATNAEAKTLGAHTYNVVVTSSTGNTAEMTVAYQVNADADTTAPAVPAITTANATIDANTYVIAGTVADDGASRTVTLYSGSEVAGSATIPIGDTTWSILATLIQGEANVFTATASDVAGNTSVPSASRTITETTVPGDTPDTTAPAIPVITTSAATVDAGDYIISGTAGADLPTDGTRTITIYRNTATVVGSITLLSGQTAWSFVAPLAQNSSNTFTAVSTDESGNNSDASNSVTITEATTADTTDPVISDIHPTSITQTSININWQTDEVSNTEVEYGFTSEYGHTSSTGNSVTNHTRSLSSLTAGTVYHYRVKSRDATGNQATSNDYVFTTESATPDTTSPPSPVITTTAATVNADYYTINGTAGADTPSDSSRTVSLYKTGNVLVGTVVLAVGQTSWSIVVSLNQSAANNFTATSTDASNNTSAPSAMVTITEAFNDTASLAVTNVSTTRSYATADNTFANGWQWVFDVTVPTGEASLSMKFEDFISGANSIPAASNVQYYSVQSNHTSASPIIISAANTYAGPIELNADLEAAIAGRQIQITVEVKVPVGTAGGSYSASYGVRSTATSDN